MPYNDIAKLAWSANYVFTDLQFKLQNAVDDELEARGHEQTKGYFFEWPGSVSQAFFNLCMEILFVPEEQIEAVAKAGVAAIVAMVLNERGVEDDLLATGAHDGARCETGDETCPHGA